ncbi:MAG TPA: DEAD/DEAH box helicase family protein [Kofleriaceae bacterium]|nr:DEAD/DEAH box helicase family protein [Kofleriaceae bacterium]
MSARSANETKVDGDGFARLANTVRLPLGGGDAPGLRAAQLAATHAICSHFWDRTRPALVVMPTGSGKTAVMMAASILLRSKRVLVVAPSRLLRDQLVENFASLDQLRDLGVVDASAWIPSVFTSAKRITSKKMWTAMTGSDVVVGTPSTLSPGLEGVPTPPEDLFDTIFFDEAHHVPARTYTAIATAFPRARQVLFTATPFRRDDKEIRGDLIFTYDLARARRDGVFGTLRFVPVEVESGVTEDEAIAKAAAAQIKADRAKKLAHRLVVRASSRPHADKLLKIYKRCTTLKLKTLHSGLSNRTVKKGVEQLRAGKLDGVIAVDMLGEGFDLPNLKVAALHSPHRSLAVTLQFIGRFARTSATKAVGDATFFAVAREVMGDAELLFMPGAEWNEIVEDLSQQRISVEKETRASIASFAPLAVAAEPMDDERENAVLWTVRPYFHAKVYEALGPVSLDVELDVPRRLEKLTERRSTKENALLWIGREVSPLRWSTHRDWFDVTHEMFLVAHMPKERLVFVCTTRRTNAVYDALIESVAGTRYRRLAPSEVVRVMRSIDNPDFFSVGMRNRAGAGGAGAESYRMMSGPSAQNAIRAADGMLYDQGHAFLRGSQNGEDITIGFSTGSKVWSNQWEQLPRLLSWFRMIASKLHDTRAVSTRTPFDKLGIASRATKLTSKIVAADLPIEAYLKPSALVRVNGASSWLVDFRVDVDAQLKNSATFTVCQGKTKLPFKYDLSRSRTISAESATAEKAVVSDAAGRHEELLVDFLNEHPPVFYLQDLSLLEGDTVSAPPACQEGG